MKGTLANTILQGNVERKISRGRPARQYKDDVKEWTGLSLKDVWREPEDRIVWRNHVSRVASNGWNSISDERFERGHWKILRRENQIVLHVKPKTLKRIT